MACKSALIAMSGGVDSSVAALLMHKAGYNCIGVTMKLFDNEDVGISREKSCCSLSDVDDARSVTTRLDIPYYIVNFAENFKEKVIEPFVCAYEKGFTPNPCIDCNRFLKFKKLYQRARELDCDYIVTGHYVRLSYDENAKRFIMRRALDEHKDQSYVLYFLSQEQLAHSQFPLGDLTKNEVRAYADEYGLVTAHKQESQDICFVQTGGYADFIENYRGCSSLPGPIITKEGIKVGEHKGLIRYTVGQRRGLGVSYKEPLFVCGKDIEHNTLIVCTAAQLHTKSILVEGVNWVSVAGITEPINCEVKVRYSSKPQPAQLVKGEDERQVKVIFADEIPGAACGQAAVFYDGDLVLGGGVIAAAF
ncbi:MAG: tRNA 2-thiouridine(34) synthase MnmA [Candidatus Bruticola sp.]